MRTKWEWEASSQASVSLPFQAFNPFLTWDLISSLGIQSPLVWFSLPFPSRFSLVPPFHPFLFLFFSFLAVLLVRHSRREESYGFGEAELKRKGEWNRKVWILGTVVNTNCWCSVKCEFENSAIYIQISLR